MSDSYNAGSARLTISPHWGTFFQQVEARLEAFNKPLQIPIEPENIHRFRSRLETQMRTMRLPPIKIEAQLDTDLLRSQLTTQIESLDRTIKLGTRLDTSAATAQLTAFRQLADRPLEIKLDLDLGGAAGDLASLNSLLGTSDKTITATVDVDTTVAEAKLDEFVRDRTIDMDLSLDTTDAVVQLASLRQFAGRTLDMRLNLDVGGAAGELSSLNGLLGMAERTIDVKLRVDTSQAMAEVQMFRMWAEHPIRVNFNLDTGAAMASLAAMQAMLAMIAAQIAAMPSFPNINPLNLLIGLFGQFGSVIGLAKTALMGLAAVSLVPLIGQVVQAAGVISLLPAMATAAATTIGTIAIGMSGVTDAFTKGAEAAKNAEKEQKATAEAVENAQQSVADAYENASRTAEQGAESIEQAEKNVQNAQKASKQAQEDLTRAREDAVERIEDLNLALKGSAIDEESAMLAVDRARRRLQRNDFKGPDADLDRRAAKIDYDQAVQRLAEVRERNGDLRKETEEANRLGVEGSEQVVAAKDRIAEADERVIEAEKNLDRTHRDVARANEQAARQIADAYDALAKAQSETASSLDEYQKALENLSPNARQFVEMTRELGDEWKTLRLAVQDSLFENLGPQLQSLAQTYLPMMTTSLTGLADVLNTKLQSAMEWLMLPEQQAGITTIFDNVTTALGPLLDGFGNIAKAMYDLTLVGSDFLPGITAEFEEGTGNFADTIHRMATTINETTGQSQLHDFMQNAIDTFVQLWNIVRNISSMAMSLFDGSDDVGDSWLDSIEKATDHWAEVFGSPEGQAQIKAFFSDVKTIVEAIVKSIEIAADLAKPFLPDPQPAPATETVDVPIIDENGNPVLDENGKPVTAKREQVKVNDDGTFEQTEPSPSGWETALGPITGDIPETDDPFQLPPTINTPQGDARGTLRKREGTAVYDGEDGRIYNRHGELLDHSSWGTPVVEGSLQDRIADVFVGSGNHPGRGADNNKQDLTGVDDFEGGGWLGSWKRAWGSGFGFNRDAWNWQEENRRRLEDGRPLINRDGTERPGTANLKYPERNVITQELTDEQFNALSPAEQTAYLEARGAGGRGRSRGGAGMLGPGEIPGDPGLFSGGPGPVSGGLEGQLESQLNTGTNLEHNGLSWDGLVQTWDTTLFPALDTAKDKVVELGGAFTDYIGDKASTAWTGLRDGVVSGWNEHIMPAWNTLRTEGLGGLADDFLAKITNGAVTSWGELPSKIGEGVGNIVDEHFPGLGKGIEKVKGFFGDLRTGASEAWNGLLQDLATGVNHMIDLINWGVGGLWSKIDTFLAGKLPDWVNVEHVSWGSGGGGSVPGMETGGFVPLEPGTQWGKDGVLRLLAPGEFVLSEPAVRAAGVDNLLAFNSAARGGRSPSTEGLFAMESGGRVTRDDPAWEMLKRGHDFAQSQAGKPYQWAGPRFVDDSFDCTGFMASIAAAILGQNVWQRYFYTGSFRGGQPGPMGFQPGLGAGFSIGIFDDPGGAGGGHAAGSLTGVEGLPDINVESSGGAGVQYGGGAAGASNSMFPWKFHLPIVDGMFVDPGPGGGYIGGPTPAEQGSVVGRFIDKLLSPLRDKIADTAGEPPPQWRTVPLAAFDALIEPVKAFAVEKASVIDVIADGVRDLKDAIAAPISNAWDFVFNRDTGGNLPPGLNLVLNKTGQDEYVLEPFGFQVIQDLIGTLTGKNPLALSAPVGTFDGNQTVLVGEAGTRQFQHRADGSTSEEDMLANMAPEARETFEQNGQGAGAEESEFEKGLREITGITIDKRPQEERMAEWSKTYGERWASWGRESLAEVIDESLSPFGLQGISIGTMVTQDVPEAMTRLTRLAELASRGYMRPMGR